MACDDCVEFLEIQDGGDNDGDHFKIICAENTAGKALYLVDAYLTHFNGVPIADIPGVSARPAWMITDPPAGENPAESGGELVSVGELFRLCITIFLDTNAAIEDNGEGKYKLRLVTERSDQEQTPVICDWEFCINRGTIDEIFVFDSMVWAGAMDQGRIMSCTLDPGNTTVTTIIDTHPHPDVPFSNAISTVAFENVNKKIYFAAQGGNDMYRCDIDGTNVEHVLSTVAGPNFESIQGAYIIPDDIYLYYEHGRTITQSTLRRVLLSDIGAGHDVIFTQPEDGIIRGWSHDELGRLLFLGKNAADGRSVYRWDGESVEEVFESPTGSDILISLACYWEDQEIWSCDVSNAGSFVAGIHAYDYDGNYLGTRSGLFFGTHMAIDNYNDKLLVAGNPNGDVKSYERSAPTSPGTTIGNISGSTGSTYAQSLAKFQDD